MCVIKYLVFLLVHAVKVLVLPLKRHAEDTRHDTPHSNNTCGIWDTGPTSPVSLV